MYSFEETVKVSINLACVQVFQIQTETGYRCAYSKLQARDASVCFGCSSVNLVHVCTFFRFKQISGFSVPVGGLRPVICQCSYEDQCKQRVCVFFKVQIDARSRYVSVNYNV